MAPEIWTLLLPFLIMSPVTSQTNPSKSKKSDSAAGTMEDLKVDSEEAESNTANNVTPSNFPQFDLSDLTTSPLPQTSVQQFGFKTSESVRVPYAEPAPGSSVFGSQVGQEAVSLVNLHNRASYERERSKHFRRRFTGIARPKTLLPPNQKRRRRVFARYYNTSKEYSTSDPKLFAREGDRIIFGRRRRIKGKTHEDDSALTEVTKHEGTQEILNPITVIKATSFSPSIYSPQQPSVKVAPDLDDVRKSGQIAGIELKRMNEKGTINNRGSLDEAMVADGLQEFPKDRATTNPVSSTTGRPNLFKWQPQFTAITTARPHRATRLTYAPLTAPITSTTRAPGYFHRVPWRRTNRRPVVSPITNLRLPQNFAYTGSGNDENVSVYIMAPQPRTNYPGLRHVPTPPYEFRKYNLSDSESDNIARNPQYDYFKSQNGVLSSRFHITTPSPLSQRPSKYIPSPSLLPKTYSLPSPPPGPPFPPMPPYSFLIPSSTPMPPVLTSKPRHVSSTRHPSPRPRLRPTDPKYQVTRPYHTLQPGNRVIRKPGHQTISPAYQATPSYQVFEPSRLVTPKPSYQLISTSSPKVGSTVKYQTTGPRHIISSGNQLTNKPNFQVIASQQSITPKQKVTVKPRQQVFRQHQSSVPGRHVSRPSYEEPKLSQTIVPDRHFNNNPSHRVITQPRFEATIFPQAITRSHHKVKAWSLGHPYTTPDLVTNQLSPSTLRPPEIQLAGDNPDVRGRPVVERMPGVTGLMGLDYPTYATVPTTSFNCAGRTTGYYADPEARCQVFHMCHQRGRRDSFLCPNGTVFHQKVLTCDHWYKVDCAISTALYYLNDNIYQPQKKRKREKKTYSYSEHLAKVKTQDYGRVYSHPVTVRHIKTTTKSHIPMLLSPPKPNSYESIHPSKTPEAQHPSPLSVQIFDRHTTKPRTSTIPSFQPISRGRASTTTTKSTPTTSLPLTSTQPVPPVTNNLTATPPPHAAVALAALSRHEEIGESYSSVNKDEATTTNQKSPAKILGPVPLTMAPHVVNPLKVKPFVP